MLYIERYAEFEVDNPDATAEQKLNHVVDLLKVAVQEYNGLLEKYHTPPFTRATENDRSTEREFELALQRLNELDEVNGKLRMELHKGPLERLAEQGMTPEDLPEIEGQEVCGPPPGEDDNEDDGEDDEEEAHYQQMTEKVEEILSTYELPSVESVDVSLSVPEPDDDNFYLIDTLDENKLLVARHLKDNRWVDYQGNEIDQHVIGWYKLPIKL